MMTAPIHPINKANNRLLVLFHDANNYVVGVCPLNVTGLRQTASGTQIAVGRGAVADAFNVKDAPGEVAERLEVAFAQMGDSAMAKLMNLDLGAMEDRVIGRMMSAFQDWTLEFHGGVKDAVKKELGLIAESDDLPREVEKLPVSKKKTA